MNAKFYQVVDTIHGSIYYTKLEKKIINTPFFNRLHDVNQNSTVYFTFPPNRTKRYEHSLGTMQLTSELFCNAAMNSSGNKAMDLLMEKADESFEDIINYLKQGGGNGKFIFFFNQRTYEVMDCLKSQSVSDIKGMIDDNFSTLFHGNCLLNYAPNGLNTGYKAFIFLCLLQSIRIVGLLHDIGHPPQSHIIESVLEEIDFELRGIAQADRNQRQQKFISIVSAYRDTEDKSVVQVDNEMAIKTVNSKKEHLHEMIGVQIIKQIINYVFPSLMENIVKTTRCAEDKINTLFYFTIIEFIFAIVRNKNAFWIGLHSIVDGTIDSDRLDFVPRDSCNSGMVWGRVPYKRLINTAKFGIFSDEGLDSSVHVCFSDKNIQQMDDLLNSRYKIFTMINYHHHSTKIAALYKRAIKILSMRYLSLSQPETNVGTAYFSDISGLWRTIEIAYSKESSALNLIQWSDSWLNGLLYRYMVEESDYNSEDDNVKKCCDYLREIFLNENHHFSLIKRQTEMFEINEMVILTISDLIDRIGEELIFVQKELADDKREINEYSLDNAGKKNIIDKLNKKQDAFNFLLKVYSALNQLDWITIEMTLGRTIVSDAVTHVMFEHKNKINSYIVEKVNFSLGTGNAYVFDYGNNVKSYYDYSNIKDVLSETRLGFPSYYIYINPKDSTGTNETFLSELRKELGVAIGIEINKNVEASINLDT